MSLLLRGDEFQSAVNLKLPCRVPYLIGSRRRANGAAAGRFIACSPQVFGMLDTLRDFTAQKHHRLSKKNVEHHYVLLSDSHPTACRVRNDGLSLPRRLTRST